MEKHKVKYWIACSGGVDSVVLVHLMQKIGKKIGILHCNFQLRGADSNKDEQFVRELAQHLSIPILVKTFDTFHYMEETGLNLELAARELRYQWFDEIKEETKADVVLGHHADDQVETFFLQLRRGGKVSGLAGMPMYRKGYFRPLLTYRKSEIYFLARKNNWSWREDLSNERSEFIRNWYRNEIIPWMEKNGILFEDVFTLTQDFQRLHRWFFNFPISNKMEKEKWRKMPFWWQHFYLFQKNINPIPVQEVNRLLKGEKGTKLTNDKYELWNETDYFIIRPKHEHQNLTPTLKSKTIGVNQVDFKDANSLFVDANLLTEEVRIRKWKSGDYFQPINMKGKKTVAKFLRDRKVPSHQKSTIYVAVHQKEICGVFGFGASDSFKITEQTKVVVQLFLADES